VGGVKKATEKQFRKWGGSPSKVEIRRGRTRFSRRRRKHVQTLKKGKNRVTAKERGQGEKKGVF